MAWLLEHRSFSRNLRHLAAKSAHKMSVYLCLQGILYIYMLSYLLTACSSHSWEADRFSASQETLLILCYSKVHYRIHKRPPLVPTWARSIQSMPLIPLPEVPSYILPSTPGSSKWSLSLRFPLLNPEYASPLPHTCHIPSPSNFFPIWSPEKLWGKDYRSFSSWLSSFLHSFVTSTHTQTCACVYMYIYIYVLMVWK